MMEVVNKKTIFDLQGKRISLGLTQEQLARKARVSLSCVSVSERSGKLYDTASGRRLARRLKVPVSELLPLRHSRKSRGGSVAALVRPVDASRGVPAIGEPKGLTAFQEPIPRAVVAIGDLFQGVAS